ncbi:radical SAM protein [Streptomyces sp. NPDC045456]|uniref:radical SAM protein n=1 Tax=Streptomyces sp. NPDC045456 TaxID=3155254 RepID=UPI00340DC583
MDTRSIRSPEKAVSCYFRTTVPHPYRKALVQITEKCNLHCAHCFVSAGPEGDTMSLDLIRTALIPQLKDSNVIRVTLTGGEPFVHPELLLVVEAFRTAGMDVGLCTNATLATDEHIEALAGMGVHANVSLDGFAAESHGKFRGNRASFDTTVATVKKFAAAGILQGLLCTPNNLAEDEEYQELCAFARDEGARYVLMNPLSSMGRGVKAQSRLASNEQHMRRIRALTEPFGDDLDLVNIRFPNDAKLPLAGCEAGRIVYVFTRGQVTVCPYLVFAANTPQSQHEAGEFIVGNIWEDDDIAARLDAYRFHDRYRVGNNSRCGSCVMASDCGKGCPAAVISAGGRIGEVDDEQCPFTPALLPVVPL